MVREVEDLERVLALDWEWTAQCFVESHGRHVRVQRPLVVAAEPARTQSSAARPSASR